MPAGLDSTTLPLARLRRSFGGCVRCKRLRSRCGEERPACQRCLRSGHVCEYRPPKANIFDPQARVGHRVEPAAAATRLPPPLTPSGNTSPETNGFFDYFWHHLAFSLARGGTLKSTATANVFYNPQWAAQLRQDNAAFNYALTSFTIILRDIWDNDVPNAAVLFAKYQAKVVHLLHAAWPNPPVESTMDVMFLVLLCETTRAGGLEPPQCLIHLRGMQGLLDMWRKSLDAPDCADGEQKKMRLALWQGMVDAWAVVGSSVEAAVPSRFYSLKMAANILYDIMWYQVVPLVAYVTSEDAWTHPPKAGARHLELWATAYQQLLARSKTDGADLAVADFYTLHHLAARVMTACLLSPTDKPFIEHTNLFVDLSKLATAAVRTAVANGGQHERDYADFFGLIPPVFLLATKCRNKSVRSIGLDLLRQLAEANVTERGWNARVAHLIAASIVRLETVSTSHGMAYDDPSVRADSATFGMSNGPTTRGMHVISLGYYRFEWSHFDKVQKRLYSVDIPVENAQDIAACKSITWPLRDTVRSFGYHSSGKISHSCLTSTETLPDRGFCKLMEDRSEQAFQGPS